MEESGEMSGLAGDLKRALGGGRDRACIDALNNFLASQFLGK